MIGNLAVRFFSAIGYFIQYSCVTHCALEYVGDFVVCTGPSMEPTIFTDDILFTEHITPRLRSFKKGDIVIAKCPTNPHQHICKRIAAVEGDQVYRGLTCYTIPIGHLWLEGDNSSNSSDSRSYGPVSHALVRGRAICKVWPFHDITLYTK